MKSKTTRKKSDRILSLLRNFYGDVEPDLRFRNTYELAIAVVLSAQTTDKQVNSVTGELFQKYPDFSSLAGAEINEIESIIKRTGFYHTKARNIVSLAKKVSADFGGELPQDMERLLELPGVGRKSANVILSIGYGLPGLAVDTHVGRISRRLGYSESDNPAIVENDLCSIIPPEQWRDVHLLFIKHGRSICKSRNPECGACPVAGLCSYYRETISS